MDTNNHVIQLCMAGARAEFERRTDEARLLYQKAWDARTNDYEACIAAHYVARFQDSPTERLRWDQAALDFALAVGDERVADFFPSLYLNVGRSHEALGHQLEAEKYFALAAALGVTHQPD